MYGELQEHKLESGETLKGYRVSIPHPKKTAIITLPTDKDIEKITEKFRKLRKKNPESEDKSPYLDLFNILRLDKNGDDWDEYEAEHIIGWTLSVQVVSAESVNDDELQVTLKTPLGEVVHFLRFPTFKEASTLKGDSKIFDALSLRSEGYAPGFNIPLRHKSTAIAEISKIHNSIDPLDNTDLNG